MNFKFNFLDSKIFPESRKITKSFKFKLINLVHASKNQEDTYRYNSLSPCLKNDTIYISS